jgi:predicted dehydrogenase
MTRRTLLLSILAPNDTIRLGFIGLGGRARWLLKNEKFPGAQIVAVADCFLPRCHQAAKEYPGGERWNIYGDYRRMFEKEKLDGVFVETTTHARALISIHAMQAGLDVYAEKPLTLTIEEGRAVARAAKRYNRVLQTGTQQRSIPINAWASKLIREGGLGKVHTVIACNFEAPKRWEPKPSQPVPDGLDWEQWVNQTEMRPYHPDLQYRWAWYRDYDGGGQSWGVTGWGTHALDQVQCALGTDDTGPVEISPTEMRYASGTVLKLTGEPRRQTHEDLGAKLIKGAPEETPEGPGENRWHIENFLECMRTRRPTNAGAEAAHRATTVCHLMNITRELNRPLRWDPRRERFDDAEANSLLSRPRRKGFELA